MQDSMKVKARIGTRVKLLEREGTVIKVLGDGKDPMIAVKLDANGKKGNEEIVGRLSLFTAVKSNVLMK